MLDYRAQLVECESELVALKADREKLLALEKQLTEIERPGTEPPEVHICKERS